MSDAPKNCNEAINDFGHLNGLARSLGIRPECRELATADEIAFCAEWMRRRSAAYLEQCIHDESKAEGKT